MCAGTVAILARGSRLRAKGYELRATGQGLRAKGQGLWMAEVGARKLQIFQNIYHFESVENQTQLKRLGTKALEAFGASLNLK